MVTVPDAADVTPYALSASELPRPGPSSTPMKPEAELAPPVPPKPARMLPVPPRPVAKTTLEKLEAEGRRPSRLEVELQERPRRQPAQRRRRTGERTGIEKRPDNLRVQNPDSEPDPMPPPYDPAWSEERH